MKSYAKLKNNKYFSTTEYDKWDGKIARSDTITDRFGSWNKALQIIDIDGGREKEYTPEELVENLENIWKELNHPPTRRQINKYGRKISERPYRRRWGSLKTACEQIALFHEGKITEEQLLLKSNTTVISNFATLKFSQSDFTSLGKKKSLHFGVQKSIKNEG